jgi:hypothetical protein
MPTEEEHKMRAVAIKKSSREKAAGFQEMGTLRCDGCGEEFFIGHHPGSADTRAAEKQAKWLEKVLAEEHERDKKHADRIELPDQLSTIVWRRTSEG